MPKEKIQITFTQEDIKELLCEKYKLDKEKTSLYISYYKGDVREPEYLELTITGNKKTKQYFYENI